MPTEQQQTSINEIRDIRIQQNPEAIRRERFNGKEHVVLPVIALVEGVLHAANAEFPELAVASEFGKFPSGWNGRPVTLGHPQREGAYISASASPEVWAEEAVGFVHNARMEGKKLHVDFYVDPDKVSPEEIERYQSGKTIEVSTGFFAEVLNQKGTYEERDYFGIQLNVVPDHIAILEEGTIGACSAEDGCGLPRINTDGKKEGEASPRVNKLDAKGDLILSGDGCSCGCSGTKEPTHQNAQHYREEQLMQLGEGREILSLGEDVVTTDLGKMTTESYLISVDDDDVALAPVYYSREEAEEDAKTLADSKGTWVGVYKTEGTREDGTIVYRRVSTYIGKSRALAKKKTSLESLAQFLLDKKTAILQTLGQGPRETLEPKGNHKGEFLTPTKPKETSDMAEKKILIDELIGLEAAPFDKDDAEMLGAFSEDQLKSMAEKYQPSKKEEAPVVNQDAKVEDFVKNGAAMDHLPSEVQKFLTNGLAKEKALKEKHVKFLVEAKYPSDEKTLLSKDLGELEVLCKWTAEQADKEVDYSGLGGGGDLKAHKATSQEGLQLIPAPSIYERKQTPTQAA